MQVVISYLLLLLTGLVMHAQNSIEVTMTNFENNDGQVHVGLYDSEDDFLEHYILAEKAEIVNGKAVVTFSGIADGVYAVSCYHDEDGSNSLNMFAGLFPTEPYGVSNNARGYFGPPKWEDAKFELNDGELKKLTIRL